MGKCEIAYKVNRINMYANVYEGVFHSSFVQSKIGSWNSFLITV